MSQRNKGIFWVMVFVAVPFAYAAYVYPSLPEIIPIHFNIKGEADGFGEKSSIYLLPSIMGVVSFFTYFLLTNLKSIDPKKYKPTDENLYFKFAIGMVVFLSILSVVITHSMANSSMQMGKVLLPLLGVAFYGMGWYMPKFHQNYFAGFKLPWTLENENNWNATHVYAGKLWKIGGACIVLFTVALPTTVASIAFIVIIAAIVIAPIVFSYRMFKRGNTLNN
jgi:uncharacterized membrane protein